MKKKNKHNRTKQTKVKQKKTNNKQNQQKLKWSFLSSFSGLEQKARIYISVDGISI